MTIKNRFASFEINRAWLFVSIPGMGEFQWSFGEEKVWSPWVAGQMPGL